MIKLLVFTLTLLISGLSQAAERQMIDTLGVSPKGQFVALEEYGYKPQKHTYYVIIKVMNVWKKEYVGSPITVELPAHRPHYLEKARGEAKALAQEQLTKFGISG
jgi:predicted secreted protein